MVLFTASQIAALTEGTLHLHSDSDNAADVTGVSADSSGKVMATGVSGVSIDSRSTSPGDLFVCLKGERHDGHEFIQAAAQKGAAGALITSPISELPPLPPNFFAIKVEDATKALGQLAAFHRKRFQIPVVGVTGSVGKTTTKEITAALLGQKWQTLKNEGNYNNDLGLPLTLFKLDHSYGACVLEMGMRGAGEIRKLTEIANPCAGIITNVGETHIELLGSVAAIATAKRELAEAIPADGLIALNADDPNVAAMAAHTAGKVIYFGMGNDDIPLDFWAENVEPLGLGGVRFNLKGAANAELLVPIPGRHNVINALAAISIAWGLGVPADQFAPGLMAYKGAPHRLIMLQGDAGQLVIDDTYNANPASMRAVLRLLSETPCTGKRVAILGDMLELGSRAAEAHREVGFNAAAAGVQLLIAYGPLSGHVAEGARSGGMEPNAIHALQNKELAITKSLELTGSGDVVVIKGSRGMAMEEIVEALTQNGRGK
jgi:UDP-N-acetylmuramoyl-tripeptide--D-alanyl-D-alanine ligase